MPPAADTRQTPGGSQAPQRVQFRTVHGTILYTPRNPFERRSRAPPTFPTPHIRPRQRRPHTIHIVSYPPGYIPSELRSILLPAQPGRSNHKKTIPPNSGLQSRRKRIFQGDATSGQALFKRRNLRRRRSAHLLRVSAAATLPNPSPSAGARVLGKLLSAFTAQSAPANQPVPLPALHHATTNSRASGFLNLSRRLSLTRTRSHDSTTLPVAYSVATNGSAPNPPPVSDQRLQLQQHQQAAPMLRGSPLVEPARPVSLVVGQSSSRRNSFMSARSVKNIMTSSVAEVVAKPLASAGGLSCAIILAEPHVFLAGFDHDGRTRHGNSNGSALLRGKLQLRVTKNVKIRAITLKLHGKARTEWPEGLPPLKIEMFEEESLRTQGLTFFHAMHDAWETPYGNQCTYALKTPTDSTLSAALSKLSSTNASHSDATSLSSGMSARDIKRLSLQQVQRRSFGKDDSPMAPPVPSKNYKVFPPGTYEYTFEMPIDHHQLETINLPFGSVKWELDTTIERSGTFKPNLHGSREVSIIRIPDQLSLETVEPISISRQWEDQLFYDIVVSGKSFPIGSKIPIAFKLMPLAKVQLHKLKVYVTESTEYWTSNRRVTRKDPGRKILLFEKTAGKPLDKQYQSSEINFLSGGELTPAQRSEARATASHRRDMEAQRTNDVAEPLPEPTENLLGDLDLGLETYWGSTELEMNVQIPTCKQMAKNPNLRLHPTCSWRNAIVHHWIKVVLRISRVVPEDGTGQRRHFEISIDSPFTVLNCLATQANTALPQYSGRDLTFTDRHVASSCGCHDACTTTTPSPTTPTGSVSFVPDVQSQQLPLPPQAAHLHMQSPSTSSDDDGPLGNSAPTSDNQARRRSAHTEQEVAEDPRPIHLLRVPSYAPPAFDADDSPPLPADIMTPPPNYDAIVGTPSVDGLADYFSRLANYDDSHDANGILITLEDDSDSGDENVPSRITSRGGRVNVANPRSQGIRHAPSRSMDIQRPSIPFHLHLASPLRRGGD